MSIGNKKLAIITTHPIQYNAPLYRLLTERGRMKLKVFYTWSQAKEKVQDAGFGRVIYWDIPLLDGYTYEFVENTAKNTGRRNFWSIKNPCLIQKIKKYDPDAILILGWNFYSHLKVMRYFKGKVPVWFRGDSHLLDEAPGIKQALRRLFLRWVYRHVDKAFYVGTNNKKYFLTHGLKEEQLVHARHAIDNQRFFDDDEKQYERRAKEWRKELGYKEEDIIILYAGKFEPVKNLELLLNAFNSIYKNNVQINLRLLLIGNGISESRLKAIAGQNPLVRFLPFQNQSKMPVVYRIGHLICLPSKSETWGLAVNEAMACGRPVIVSDKVGCAADLVKKEWNGFVFNSGSEADLENNLLRLLFDPSLLKKIKENALIRVIDYSFIRIAQALESIL